MRTLGRLMAVAIVVAGVATGQGCRSWEADSYHRKLVEDGLAAAQTGSCIDCRWYGANHWRLSEGGWDGGGHGPYEVNFNTSNPDCRAVWDLRNSVLLLGDPNLLLPLFDSHDAEVLLTAMHLYRGEYEDKETPAAARVRSLLKHRDVRVRCMAATKLSRKPFLTMAEIDGMLGDSDLSVQIIGVEAARKLSTRINVGINPVLPELSSMVPDDPHDDEYYFELNRELISVLLKHLNDNHFYIRAECYYLFRHQIGKGEPRRRNHFGVDVPETFPRYDMWWAHAAWIERRDMQQEMVAWWEEEKGELRKVSED